MVSLFAIAMQHWINWINKKKRSKSGSSSENVTVAVKKRKIKKKSAYIIISFVLTSINQVSNIICTEIIKDECTICRRGKWKVIQRTSCFDG